MPPLVLTPTQYDYRVQRREQIANRFRSHQQINENRFVNEQLGPHFPQQQNLSLDGNLDQPSTPIPVNESRKRSNTNRFNVAEVNLSSPSDESDESVKLHHTSSHSMA